VSRRLASPLLNPSLDAPSCWSIPVTETAQKAEAGFFILVRVGPLKSPRSFVNGPIIDFKGNVHIGSYVDPLGVIHGVDFPMN